MRSMELGTMQWARSSGGEVKGVEAVGLWWGLVRAQVVRRFAAKPVAGFRSPEEVARALVEVSLPSSRLVTQTLELVSSLGPPSLVGHVLRTWAFGTLLGMRDGLRWDSEVLCTAALLHDLALARRRHEVCCFAHDGAQQALTFLAEQGVEPWKREAIAEAICLHLRLFVPPSLGVEAHLVNAGAAVDVVGARADELGAPMIGAVLERHPRGDLMEVLLPLLAEEKRRHPTARVSRWMSVGFGALVRKNPLARVS